MRTESFSASMRFSPLSPHFLQIGDTYQLKLYSYATLAKAAITCIEEFPTWTMAEYEVTVASSENNKFVKGTIAIQMHSEALRKSEYIVFEHKYRECFTLTVKITEYYDPVPCLPVTDRNFSTPTADSDVSLLVGGATFHVSKHFMAVCSNFFKKLFFGDFAEKDKDEVELKDVDQEKFRELLQAIHPDRKPITWDNVDTLLEMADRFQCLGVRQECVRYMSDNRDERKVFEKLLLADRHQISEILDLLVDNMSGAVILSALKYGRERYSDALITRLGRRLGTLM